MSIEIGKKAPHFSLPNQDGELFSLKEHLGKNIILYFYPRDNTPGCTKEAEGFKEIGKALKKLNAIVIGVSPDNGASHCKFRNTYALPFDLLCDEDKKVMIQYGAYGEKMLYGKKTIGIIRSTVWIGTDGKIKKHWAKVANAALHPEQVLKFITENS